MTIERIEDLKTEPIVGRSYLVPCVQRTDGIWWPVIGSKHSDAEYIGFEPQHWHYDLRFFDADQMDRVCRRGIYRPLAALFGGSADRHPLTDDEAVGSVIRAAVVMTGPELRAVECFRAQPDGWKDGAFFLPDLEAAYADKRVTCGKCPHRGAPLASLPKDANGHTTCVLHGLKWDLSTGKMVRR